jgi:hypothetical protein
VTGDFYANTFITPLVAQEAPAFLDNPLKGSKMGKNYSGTGMYTNTISRLWLQRIPEPTEPFIQYLPVLDHSEALHGNAAGIGLANFTRRRLVEKIDYEYNIPQLWICQCLECCGFGFPTASRASIAR